MRIVAVLLVLAVGCGDLPVTRRGQAPPALEPSAGAPSGAAGSALSSAGSSAGPGGGGGSEKAAGASGAPAAEGGGGAAGGADTPTTGGMPDSSEAGAGGMPAEPLDPPDPCETPSTWDCDGVCGAPTAACSANNYCGAYGTPSSSASFVFAKGTDRPGCPCDGFGYRLVVAAGTCSKATGQPGADIRFSRSEATCETSARLLDCLVVSGISEGSLETSAIWVDTTANAGWVHYESAPLVGASCPLSCP